MAHDSQNREQRIKNTDQKTRSDRDQAPRFRVFRRGLCARDIADRNLSIHLRGVDNRGNPGRQATEDSGQDREHQIVGDVGSRRGARLLRYSCNGGLEFGAALVADDCCVLIEGSTLGTEHCSLMLPFPPTLAVAKR
jgi:hypothetical protein